MKSLRTCQFLAFPISYSPAIGCTTSQFRTVTPVVSISSMVSHGDRGSIFDSRKRSIPVSKVLVLVTSDKIRSDVKRLELHDFCSDGASAVDHDQSTTQLMYIQLLRDLLLLGFPKLHALAFNLRDTRNSGDFAELFHFFLERHSKQIKTIEIEHDRWDWSRP
ncbi:hypothetical protein M378DRAFT_626502 [Amanita muscaria Koide BX008]|uniref:Uncharacterized protein n=1 Tax=Amanita muscaria (strain Koide BX008) TaxID=946122 RepID=A0A0C2X862_AMAMK|nr:hypothetical protein M378DRAFT_626502 [Amanita muscaria Koide BX008]